jgi:serine/threonine protein kinase
MPVSDPLPPRYRDPQRIGFGGMGEIYRATDAELGRDVAVKLMSERFAQDDALRERFKREALAAARLSGNPNIVTIFDVGEHAGRPMIVMEHLSGGSLERRIRGRGPCSPAQVLEWLDEAADALDAAHDAGVVHRDVKPGNLLLDARDHVHVADFGIASAAGLESFTQTGTILGTAGYLSPEQAGGDRATAASDRYALAVVAWELWTGRRPFESESPTAEAVAQMRDPVPSIHDANPQLPVELDAVFRRALDKHPATRYGTAAELVGAMRAAFADAAGATRRVGRTTAITERRAQTVPRQGSPASRRMPWLVLLVLGALVAAGAAAALLLSRGSHRSVPPPQPRTVVKTVTEQGSTIRETVTTHSATTTARQSTSTSPAALNDAGYAKMRAGDFSGALPLLEQAVQELSGSGQLDEAYADFNLAYTRFQLGDCTDVLSLLDHAQSIEGHRKAIDDLRHQAHKQCR